jgi:hypothetical protein
MRLAHLAVLVEMEVPLLAPESVEQVERGVLAEELPC